MDRFIFLVPEGGGRGVTAAVQSRGRGEEGGRGWREVSGRDGDGERFLLRHSDFSSPQAHHQLGPAVRLPGIDQSWVRFQPRVVLCEKNNKSVLNTSGECFPD